MERRNSLARIDPVRARFHMKQVDLYLRWRTGRVLHCSWETSGLRSWLCSVAAHRFPD